MTELQALVQELMAKGVSRAEATAQARKTLAEVDRVVVDNDGNERPAPVGSVL